MQNWILNKETGRYEILEDSEKDRNKKRQMAIFEYINKKEESQDVH